MKKIRKGDDVIVIAGKDKGKTGEVLSVVSDDKVVVQGVAIAKKHTKPNPAKGITGGLVDKAMPIHISNVAIYNSDTKKADKVAIKIENNKNIRVFKSTGKLID